MLGIKIKDSKKVEGGGSHLSFDLRDILAAIGDPVNSSTWICREVEYTMTKEGEFYEGIVDRQKLTGAAMLQFAADIRQTIDGRFEARSGGPAKKLWLIIRVFDSSWFEVWSSKREVIEKVRAHFNEVSDLPANTIP